MSIPCKKATCPPLEDFLEYNTPRSFSGVKTLATILLQECIRVNTNPPNFCAFYETYTKKFSIGSVFHINPRFSFPVFNLFMHFWLKLYVFSVRRTGIPGGCNGSRTAHFRPVWAILAGISGHFSGSCPPAWYIAPPPVILFCALIKYACCEI